MSWEIEPQDGGFTKLTVVHDQLEESLKTAESVTGGWSYILSGLKTYSRPASRSLGNHRHNGCGISREEAAPRARSTDRSRSRSCG